VAGNANTGRWIDRDGMEWLGDRTDMGKSTKEG
jgi:hypothetical protein